MSSVIPELPHDVLRALVAVLHRAIGLDSATKGNVQLVDGAGQALRIVAHSGFDDAFIRAFATVSWDDGTACGRAFRTGARIFIPDVTLDAAFTPYVDVARAAGYLAVQSTPMLDVNGQVIGILSTHFPGVQELSNKAARVLDTLARDAARHVEQFFA